MPRTHSGPRPQYDIRDASAPCEDPRYERFCQLLLTHERPDAFAEAFAQLIERRKIKSRGDVMKLAKHAEMRVAGRVKYLASQAASRIAVTADGVLHRLRQVLDGNLARIMVKLMVDPETGMDTKEIHIENLRHLTESEQMALAELKQDKDGNWSVKLHPRVPSAELLAQHLRLLSDDKNGVDRSPPISLTIIQGALPESKPKEIQHESVVAFPVASPEQAESVGVEGYL